MKLRALVIDDSALFRRVITDALTQLADIEVVGSAPNGKIGLERIVALNPDLVTLDMEMPEMGGLEVLDALKGRGRETCVVVVSALTLKGGSLTIRALEKGAFDFITKPSGGDPSANLAAIRQALAPVVDGLRRRLEIRSILKTPGQRSDLSAPPSSPGGPRPLEPSRASLPQTGSLRQPAGGIQMVRMVLVGISTGGPNALAQMLPSLPGDLPVPVLIVQHMPALFTQSLAASLAARCALMVKEAADGETLRPGGVYIAPGGRHLKVVPGANAEMTARISDDPPENNCRPSADVLFRSASLHYPGQSIAVIMTGMGADGVLGLRLLKRHPCRVIAQDAESCVVYGMPGEAVKAGVVDVVLPLNRIADEISRLVKGIRL